MALSRYSDYHLPASIADAVNLLAEYGDEGMIVAGGTFVHGLEARGLLDEVRVLIDVSRLGLAGIQAEGGGLILGATTVLGALKGHLHENANPAWGALEDALRYPPVQILNAGTVGGCLAAAAPMFDLPAALLALDATIEAQGADGSRQLALQNFFAGLFENALNIDELITAISVPAPTGNSTSAFLKLETNANDLAIVNVAVRFKLADGKCQDSRIVIGGGVGESYVRATAAEETLNGAAAEDSAFKLVADTVAKNLEAISDHRASANYRKHVAGVYTRRALSTAAKRLD